SMNAALIAIIQKLPTDWVENFISTFEAGRLQKHPQARFVNARGECCLVGALAGARSTADFARSAQAAGFVGTALETLSRGFETRRLTGQQFYEEALLVVAARRTSAMEMTGV
ncbi:MAG: hypothetical protein ACREIV_13330, partial [Planctomycetaceae bacterium]